MYLESIRSFSPKDSLSSFTRACFLPGIAYSLADFSLSRFWVQMGCRFKGDSLWIFRGRQDSEDVLGGGIRAVWGP